MFWRTLSTIFDLVKVDFLTALLSWEKVLLESKIVFFWELHLRVLFQKMRPIQSACKKCCDDLKKRTADSNIVFILFYLPYLSSIHERANCIAILWTVSPHSLGSCLFRGFMGHLSSTWRWGVPLSALPKDTTSELAGLFSTTSPKCRAPSREAVNTIF